MQHRITMFTTAVLALGLITSAPALTKITATTTYPQLNYIATPTKATLNNLQFTYNVDKIQRKTPFNVVDSHLYMKMNQNINRRDMVQGI